MNLLGSKICIEQIQYHINTCYYGINTVVGNSQIVKTEATIARKVQNSDSPQESA